MKAEILKIAGVKSEKEFYKKYPTEEAFMKAHKKEFKKAAMGSKMVKTQLEQLTDFGNPPIAQLGIPLGANPSGSFDWTMGSGDITGQSVGMPTLPGGNAQGMFDISSQTGYRAGATPISGMAAGKTSGIGKFFNNMGGMQGLTNIAGNVIGGIQGIKQYKKQKKALQTQIDVAKVVDRAARLPEERIKRQYLRPEDMAFEPDQLFPTYGVGTNYLAKDGTTISQIGGNPTEIQNMYNPGDLYSNLGYEPLNDSDRVKQYEGGGFIPMAQEGYSTADSLGTFLNTFGGGKAGGVGVPGTLGGAVAPALAFVDFAIKDIQKRNLSAMANQANQLAQSTMMRNVGQGIHSQYSKFMEDGGWVSHDWQPQVIAKFGEYDVNDLLQKDPMMDTLRTGGRITQNNMYPQDQYALGGELKTTWGGYAEPISYNPKMPGTGEMVMFKGLSKDVGAHSQRSSNGETGIGVKYGEGGKMTDYAEFGTEQADADVEVEKGEPATEMIDPETGEKNMVVFGDLYMNRDIANYIGRPDAEGMKYKNFMSKVIAPEENKQNKIKQKVSNLIELNDDGTPFGELAMNSARAMDLGSDMNLSEIANVKYKAADSQTETNKLAEVFEIDAAEFAKGKIKLDKEAMKQTAKYGKEIFKAQNGDKYKVKGVQPGSIDYNPIGEAGNEELWGSKEKYSKNWVPKVDEALSDPERAKQIIAQLESYTGQDAKDVVEAIKKQKTLSGKIAKIQELGTDQKVGPYHNLLNQVIDKTGTIPATTSTFTTNPYIAKQVVQDQPVMQQVAKKKGFDVLGTINSLLPYLDRPYQEEFDISQIYPELAAVAMNKVEPVKAQGIQPLLETPYDISYQDRINEVTASERAALRMAGQDPAAAAMIFSKSSAAKDAIKAEQFRENQAMKAGVYGRNRATLNQAMLTNLGIYADQEQKQRKAEAITKATFLEALGSMTDKKAKQKLENRKFAVMANMFPNYRFTGDMRAIPKGLTLFNPPVVSGGQTTGAIPALATNPYVSGDRTTQASGKTANVTAPKDMTDAEKKAMLSIMNSDYGELPSLEDLYKEETVYPTEQKYGGKTKKKKTNGSIVKAIKNL